MTSSAGSRSRCSTTSRSGWRTARGKPTLIPRLCAVLAIACASGCGSRTIFVPEESPMRIGPDSRIRVYHRIDGVWTLSQNRIEIPEGWYLVPPSYLK